MPEKKAEARIRAKSKTLSQKVDSDSNQLPIHIYSMNTYFNLKEDEKSWNKFIVNCCYKCLNALSPG